MTFVILRQGMALFTLSTDDEHHNQICLFVHPLIGIPLIILVDPLICGCGVS